MRSVFIILLAAACACAVAATGQGDEVYLPSVPEFESCFTNPYLYILGYLPSTEPVTQPFWTDIPSLSGSVSCPTLTGSISCCDASYQVWAAKYMDDLDDRLHMFEQLIEGINHINEGIQYNLNDGGVVNVLKMLDFFGVRGSIPVPEVSTAVCGPSMVNGILNLNGTTPDCMVSFMVDFFWTSVQDDTARAHLNSMLHMLSSNYERWSAAVNDITVALDAYAGAVVCGGCQHGYVARNALAGFVTANASEASIQQLYNAVNAIQQDVVDFVWEVLTTLMTVADRMAVNAGIAGDVRSTLDALLTLLDVPIPDVWRLLSRVVAQLSDAVTMYFGTAAGPVLNANGVTPTLLNQFVDWAVTCKDGIVYTAVGFITLEPLSLFSNTLYESVQWMFGIQNGVSKSCYNSMPFANWLRNFLTVLMDDNKEFPIPELVWRSASVQAAIEGIGRVNQKNVDVLGTVSPWLALQAAPSNATIVPMTEPLTGSYPYPFRVFDKDFLSGFGLIDPDPTAYEPKNTTASGAEAPVLKPWPVAPPVTPSSLVTKTNEFLVIGALALLGGIGACFMVSGGIRSGWFGLAPKLEARAAARAAAEEDFEEEDPEYYEYEYEYSVHAPE